MEKSLARYIWVHTRPQQLAILLIVALSMIPYYLAFDLPKQIVNGPIQGDGFSTPDAQETFLRLVIDLPDWLSKAEPLVLFDGFSLDRLQMLMALSAAFLVLVIINGLFKLYINTFKGRLGERHAAPHALRARRSRAALSRPLFQACEGRPRSPPW
jgi:putative ABC transport system ATP-binding protein